AEATRDTGPDGAATVLVVDEAYAEFRREGTPSAVTLLPEHPHLAVARTMSKAFAYAGARIGYLAAAPELVDALRVVRLPYHLAGPSSGCRAEGPDVVVALRVVRLPSHLSAVTQPVARAALAHADVLQKQVAAIRTERDACVAWLRERGFVAVDSDANFVLFGTFADRRSVWQGLLDRGVLIRETGPEQYLRVSIGTPEEMAAFRDALTEVTGA